MRALSFLVLSLVLGACTPGLPYQGEGDSVTLIDGSLSRDASQDTASGDTASAASDVGVSADAGGTDAGGMDSGPPPFDAGSSPPSSVDADDMELFALINDYRATRSLPAIPLSPSLSEVARAHVSDLIAHGANSGSCNLHSWSSEGAWSGCCYTSDHSQASCMWNKPRELTDYPGNGYEISSAGARDAAHALSLWQGSAGHHDVIINAGSWSRPWGAMGVAITPGAFAHVWFGREADPAL